MEVKPYSVKELRVIYGISRKTLYKWLQPHHHLIGKRSGHFYTVKQVNIIIEILGRPGEPVAD